MRLLRRHLLEAVVEQARPRQLLSEQHFCLVFASYNLVRIAALEPS